MTVAALNRVKPHTIVDRHEDELAGAYERVLRDAGRRAASRFKRLSVLTAAADEPTGNPPNWTPPNIDELVDLELIATQTVNQTRTIQLKVLAQVVNAYGETISQITAPDIGVPSFEVTNPLSLSLVDQLGGRAGDVAKSVRDDLQKIIGDAYTAGFSVNRTAAQIVELSDQFSKAQSRMLARTDLNGIANGGSHIAASEVGVAYKTWLATEDERTRETHQEADGQTVPLDQQFDVGGESADYPGDPALSDAEAANCRCTLIYEDSLPEDVGGDLQASGAGATIGGQMDEPQITIPLQITVGNVTNTVGTSSAANAYVKITPTASRFATELLEESYLIDGLPFAATGSTDLPLSDRNRAWDAGAARKSLEPGDFAKAHFWRDPNGPPDQISSYKFPFAARINGTLTAVWAGVTAGAQRLSQAQGVDTSAIQAKMGAYYRKAATQYKDPSIKVPWSVQSTGDPIGEPGTAGPVGVLAAGMGPTWRAVLCVEGEPTEDGRLLEPGSISWRELPLSLLAQT